MGGLGWLGKFYFLGECCKILKPQAQDICGQVTDVKNQCWPMVKICPEIINCGKFLNLGKHFLSLGRFFFWTYFNKFWAKNSNNQWRIQGGNPGAQPPSSPRTKIFLISCSFWEIPAYLYVGAPLGVGAPPKGNPVSASDNPSPPTDSHPAKLFLWNELYCLSILTELGKYFS